MQETVEIRKATKEDASAIQRIYNHYIRTTVITFEEEEVSVEEMAGRINRYDLPWFVAILQGQVIGYAYAGQWKPRSAYKFTVETSIYLDASVHQRGVGFTLYKHLINTLKRSDVHAVLGGIAQPNEASVRLHEKLGFEKVGQLKQVGRKLGRWVDVGYWQLVLDGKTLRP
jgi:phosphinothricin acetyltransferase